MTDKIDAEKLRHKITVYSVTRQIEDGWTNPYFIVKNIVGLDVWNSLPEWDQKILVAIAHRIAVDNEHLRDKYFA